MATWPNIENPSGLREITSKKQQRSEFDAGYVQSRPLWTRTRKKWKLDWSAMSMTDLDTLQTFFSDNQGGEFTWTHPETGVSYTARFSNDSFESNRVSAGFYRVTIEIEEQ